MQTIIKRFFHDESGATAIEYGLLAALIAVAIIVMVTNVGTSLQDVFEEVDTSLTGAVAG
jgi:pilus assembly protein Flp/PilA